ncbi:MAG TPA: hypothetical protein VG204_07790 [Terriglobia bacterium]|nr:hypothetical protein [Terriglobia bacterium]
MVDNQNWEWEFLGFESVKEGRPVQVWFDLLPEGDRFEIIDLFIWLRAKTRSLWTLPEFDPLDGEGGISEIRVPEIRTADGSVFYRIYGVRGARELERSYILLHGTDKVVKNDIEGKRIAKRRLGELERREQATVHSFDFERGHGQEIEEEPGGEG